VAAVAALERAASLSDAPALRTSQLLRGAELAVELGQQEVVNRLLRAVEPLDLSLQQRAQLIWINGRLDDGIHEEATFARSLTALAEEVAKTGDTDLALKLLDRAALHSFWTADGPEVGNAVIECAERLPVEEHDARLLAILAFANAIDRGAVVFERLHQIDATSIEDAPTSRLLGAAALMVGDFDFARARYQAAAPDLRAQGRLALLARAMTALAWVAGHLVDLGVAIPAGEEGSRLAEETRLPVMRATARATEAMLAALRGEHHRADAFADEAELGGVPAGARPVLAMVQHARGLDALGAGRHAEAYEHLQRMHDPADPAYHFSLRCSAFGDLAEAAAYSGNGHAIGPLVADMEAVALKTPSPALHAGLRHARALLAHDDEAEGLFHLALEADTTRRPFVRGRAQFCYGAWLRRHRRTAESRAPLRSARDTFDALGAIPWSERARQELRASGETSRRRTPDARDQLTPQELQIAQMAAEGLTNREIGERLYLSHRTVGAHLYRIFPKLGITARVQLRSSLGAPVPG
jgi:DNA-binding CsgD family transcriptional regulator